MAARPYLTSRANQDTARANANIGLRTVAGQLVTGRAQIDCSGIDERLGSTSGGDTPILGPPRALEDCAQQLTSACCSAYLVPGLGHPIVAAAPRQLIHSFARDTRHHLVHQQLTHHYLAFQGRPSSLRPASSISSS